MTKICTPKLFLVLALSVAVSTAAHAQIYTDLLNFDSAHGANPSYPQILAQGRDGNLYGTTAFGNDGLGVVFRVTPSGMARVLHYFNGSDGARPYSGLTLGRDGNFYGTTFAGGSNRYGTIFRITPNGKLTTLYNFSPADGQPYVPPIQAADGNFYGTAGKTAYRIMPSGTFTSLGSIPGVSYGPLLQGTDGNFYGTTVSGGTSNFGTVFKMTPNGVVSVAYNFDASVSQPDAPLLEASDGNFYGATVQGGSNRYGVVFELTPQRAIVVLHSFPDPNYPNDGTNPIAGIVQASDGNFYGVTFSGGLGYGVAFEIIAASAYSILYSFDSTGGGNPGSTPMQHTNGEIYGLTEAGGSDNYGVTYSLDLGLGQFVSLLPTAGRVGETVGFLGQGFTGASAVSFNGSSATFTVESDTYLTAIVPSGATTGAVMVTTPVGTLNSNKAFRVTP